MRKISNTFQKLLQVKHNQFIADLSDINPKRLWSYMRSKTKTKCPPSKIDHEGASATNP